MAKIKVVKKEKSLADNMSDDYRQLLKDTGAYIYRKPGKTANYSVLSTYSVTPKRERGPKKKKRKK